MAPRITPPEVPAVEPLELEHETPMPVVSAKGTRDRVTKPVLDQETNERITLIAHDLKTPLSIIMLESQLLADKLPPELLPRIEHSIERITQNAAYIDRLIADLLDLATVDAGQLELRHERIDLGELLRETLERAVSTVDRERVKLELRCAAIVRADRNRLERVVANFVSNALKYSTTSVTVALSRGGERRCRVTVIDRGRGLTPDQARTVFDRYRRGSNTRGREGHGLGLYIARKIIDAHFGRIGVVSAAGKGSEFFFELDTIR